MEILIILIGGIACAIIASSKNRSAFAWFFLGCLLPLISLIIIICLGKADPEKLPPETMKCPHCDKVIRSIATECRFCGKAIPKPEEFKQCPFCAETIKKAAIVCKHCGRDLPQEEPAAE